MERETITASQQDWNALQEALFKIAKSYDLTVGLWYNVDFKFCFINENEICMTSINFTAGKGNQ